MMNFQFLMPDVEGYGVWQMDTGSYHGITGIYDSLAYLKLFGDVAGVPLRLTLEPKEVSPDGRKKTVHVPRLTHAGKLADMLQAVERPRWALSAAVMPEPDEDARRPDALAQDATSRRMVFCRLTTTTTIPTAPECVGSPRARLPPFRRPIQPPARSSEERSGPEPPRQTIGQLIAGLRDAGAVHGVDAPHF